MLSPEPKESHLDAQNYPMSNISHMKSVRAEDYSFNREGSPPIEDSDLKATLKDLSARLEKVETCFGSTTEETMQKFQYKSSIDDLRVGTVYPLIFFP
jgi:hypothetical protein